MLALPGSQAPCASICLRSPSLLTVGGITGRPSLPPNVEHLQAGALNSSSLSFPGLGTKPGMKVHEWRIEVLSSQLKTLYIGEFICPERVYYICSQSDSTHQDKNESLECLVTSVLEDTRTYILLFSCQVPQEATQRPLWSAPPHSPLLSCIPAHPPAKV